MDGIARAAQERAELCRETANRRNLDDAIIEKDFWVCWTLSKLFQERQEPPSLLFKGGTSLSKVFGVINRFSEDIDLSLDRHDFGFRDERDPANAPSGKETERLLDELQVEAIAYLRDRLVPNLKSIFLEVLGDSSSWRLEIDSERPLLVVFSYPAIPSAVDPGSSSYVEPAVQFVAHSNSEPGRIIGLRRFTKSDRTRLRCSLTPLAVLSLRSIHWRPSEHFAQGRRLRSCTPSTRG